MDEFELGDGDGFEEIAKAGTRQTIDEEFAASGRKEPRINKTGRGSPVTGPKIKKLADRDCRWTDHLSPDEERYVIRKAKDDDPEARDGLYRCYHKALIKIAGSPKFGGPPFEDRLAAAGEGLFKALKGYNLNRNNGLWAYAKKFIIGAVADCVHDWHQCGGKLETRAERANRKNGQGFRPICTTYNGVECSHDEDQHGAVNNPNAAWGNQIDGWIAADDAELHECDGSAGKVTDADWDRIVEGRKVLTNWCPNHPRGCGPLSPCKEISRQRYEEDQALAHRFDTAAFVRQRLSERLARIGRNLGVPRECIGVDENPNRNGGPRPNKSRIEIRRASFRCDNPLPLREYLKQNPTPKHYQADASKIRGNPSPLGIIGYLAKDAELRARRRLAQVGRCRYAQELAAKDRRAAEDRPLQQHLYRDAVPKPNHFRKSKYCALTEAHLKEAQKAKPRRGTHIFDATAATRGLQVRGSAPPNQQNAKRRMNALVLAVDNGVENGTIKYNNAVQLGGAVHRADRGHSHDVRKVRRATGQSSH